MIYNCELCNLAVYTTDLKNLNPIVVRKSMLYEGHRWCHSCVDNIYNNKFKMEVFHETV